MTTPICAAADWGTSRFRLWLLGPKGEVLGERRSDEGMAQARSIGFSAVLEGHLAALGADSDLPVVVCGMAGSQQGWVEAGYVGIPAPIAAVLGGAVAVPGGRPVRILPGLSQAAPADVMRGEETQVLGALDAGMRDGIACLPGTHSKWVGIDGDAVAGFATFMTGEVFAALSRHTILQHTLGEDAAVANPAFLRSVAAARAAPETALGALFALRAGPLLGQAGAGAAGLSGHLIGLELAGGFARFGVPARISLIASGPLAVLYRAAFEAAGVEVTVWGAEGAARAGLLRAADAIWGRA